MIRRYIHNDSIDFHLLLWEDVNMRRWFWAAFAVILLLPVSAFAADSLLVDNKDTGYVEIGGTWQGSSYGYQDSSRYSIRADNPLAAARWTPPCSTADKYNVYYYLPNTEFGCDNAKYVIVHSAARDSIYKNQNTASGNWIFLGAYDFDGDSSGYVEVVNDTSVASAGFALWADATLFEAVGDTQDIHLVYFSHDFGVVDPGDSSFWTFDFSNVGGDTLTVSSISTSTIEFTVTDPISFPILVAPGATVDVTIKFQPFSPANYADSVQITSDDPDSAEVVRQVQLEGRSGVLLVDDGDAGYSEPVGTTWTSSTGGFQGDSRYALVSSDTNATAQYVPNVPAADTYNVFYFFGVTGSSNSATAAKFKIYHATGSDSVYRNQNLRSGEKWQFLGQHQFDAGTGGKVEIINDVNAPGWGGYAFRADAIKLEQPTEGPDLYVIDYDLDFGEVTVGQYTDRSFMAHNIGDSAVSIDSVVFTDTVFSVASAPASIAAGVTDTITIRFSPSDQVTYSSEAVTIYNDDGELAPSVILEGEGVGNLVIIDNLDGPPTYVEQGSWNNSIGGYGPDSRFSWSPSDTSQSVTFTPDIPVSDYYDVYHILPNSQNADDNALYVIRSSSGDDSMRVDQDDLVDWEWLATYYFDAGTSGFVKIINDSLCTGAVVRADAIKFQQATGDSIPPEAVTDLTAEKSGGDIYLNWSPADDIYTGVDYYIIFRSTTPNFTPTSGDSIGEALTPGYLDVGAVGIDYYYEVRAVDKVGLKGDYSNQVGEFDKNLSNVK
jgi:hypothetical protein